MDIRTLEDPGVEEYIGNKLEQQQSYDMDRPLLPNGQQSVDVMERAVTGRGRERNILSPVRQTFIILVVFDMLLAFTIWFMYCQDEINGKNCTQKKDNGILHLMKREVMYFYCISKFLFDIVMLALLRGLILLLVYCCVRQPQWYAVLCTTLASTIFLVVKICLFRGEACILKLNKGLEARTSLIISSLIICWFEWCYLHFHVVPRERAVYENLVSLPGQSSTANHQLRHQEFNRSLSDDLYSTPCSSPIRTDENTLSILSSGSAELNEVESTDQDFIRRGKDIVQKVIELWNITDGWTIECQEKDKICVSTRLVDGFGKYYKLDSVIDVPSKVLIKLLWEDVECQPQWNPSVKTCQVKHRVNRKTDMVHTVASRTAGGIISPRDFALLRRRKKQDQFTLLCSASVKTDIVPEGSSIVRGHNGPGAFIMRDKGADPNKTEFHWLFNATLKGWIPERFVEQSLVSVMVDTVRSLRSHAATLPQH